MRVTYAWQGLLAASSTMAASYNPQHIVLGTDGMVVVGADPSLYFRTSRNQLHRDQNQAETELELAFHFKQTEPDELSVVVLPTIHNELLEADNLDSTDQELDEDEFSNKAEFQDDTSFVSWRTFGMTDDGDIPGVYGSVVFAELSCCFVAFIGYLVRSIPLWVGFSSGQKCCLIVAFSVAILYQFATLGWYFGAVTSEFMLGLSSLITRMISLGMVPITTTSFMGRAREICQDRAVVTASGSRKSSHSRNSRRHHARARSS